VCVCVCVCVCVFACECVHVLTCVYACAYVLKCVLYVNMSGLVRKSIVKILYVGKVVLYVICVDVCVCMYRKMKYSDVCV
jgi:hypothetical protein